jgi:hypothetical protein
MREALPRFERALFGLMPQYYPGGMLWVYREWTIPSIDYLWDIRTIFAIYSASLSQFRGQKSTVFCLTISAYIAYTKSPIHPSFSIVMYFSILVWLMIFHTLQLFC